MKIEKNNNIKIFTSVCPSACPSGIKLKKSSGTCWKPFLPIT